MAVKWRTEQLVLKSWITEMAQGFGKRENPYRTLLRSGRLFRSQPLTCEESRKLDQTLSTSRLRFRPKACFANAQRLALRSEHLQYAEGYIILRGFGPILHGWNILGEKVIDVTLREEGNKIAGNIPDGIAYYGVPIEAEEVRQCIRRWQAYTSVLEVRAGWTVGLNQRD